MFKCMYVYYCNGNRFYFFRDIFNFDKETDPIKLNLENLRNLKDLYLFTLKSEVPVHVKVALDWGRFEHSNTIVSPFIFNRSNLKKEYNYNVF